MSGCPCNFIHTIHSATNQSFKYNGPQSWTFPVYISLVKMKNTFIGPVYLLIDTSSGPYGMILWLQLSYNVIPKLQSIFTILTQLSHLQCTEFVGLHATLLIIIFNINFTHLVHITQ